LTVNEVPACFNGVAFAFMAFDGSIIEIS